MAGTINHIEINVSNLKRSIIFWEWLLLELGYEKFQEWNLGISFKLNDTYIVFVQTEKPFLQNKYHRKNTGLNHLAFSLDKKAEVDEITRKLKEKAIKILYQDKHPFAGGENHYAVYFEDPDGIKVEVAVSKK